MMAAQKLIALLLAWSGIAAALARYFPGRRKVLLLSCVCGFAGGMFLLALCKVDSPASIIRFSAGAAFLSVWMTALTALYRVTGRGGKSLPSEDIHPTPVFMASGAAVMSGLLAGAISVYLMVPKGGAALPYILTLGLASALFAGSAIALERFIPKIITLTTTATLTLVVSLLLFATSLTLQLDLFAPLSMKVMKFIHDFVHQFFESMLVPDHLFFRHDVWVYIGYLFSRGVGFWGGLLLWFAPVILVGVAIRLEPLPPVSHIRQGAERRKQLANFIRVRRNRLIVPGFTMLILAAAVYNSSYPNVEYWDPPPVVVTMNPSGMIVIPKKGEIDLEDGKLHKYLFRQKGREARFMILMTPNGKLTVTLDACAICKPDGYGQTEGAVICYYCKTLIPLETVGRPGGCNPVPLPFEVKEEGISIDALTILNRWGETVTSTSRIEGGGK